MPLVPGGHPQPLRQRANAWRSTFAKRAPLCHCLRDLWGTHRNLVCYPHDHVQRLTKVQLIIHKCEEKKPWYPTTPQKNHRASRLYNDNQRSNFLYAAFLVSIQQFNVIEPSSTTLNCSMETKKSVYKKFRKDDMVGRVGKSRKVDESGSAYTPLPNCPPPLNEAPPNWSPPFFWS